MEQNTREELPRRKFFRLIADWFLKLILFFTAGGGIVMALSFLYPPKKLMRRLTGWVPTVDKSSLQLGDAAQILFNGIPYFVLRVSNEEYRSFSAVCSHAACIVFWEKENMRFACPCHESKFSIAGEPVGGPAQDPLTRMALKIDDTGKIFIKLV